MFKTSVAALAAASIAGSAFAAPGDAQPPRLTGADVPAGRAWIEAHLAIEDWLPAGGADRQFWFVSALPNEAPNYPLVRDWVRSEIADDYKGAKSMLLHIEVDCDKARARTLESYYYRDNNLRGPFYVGSQSAEKWDAAPSGSIRETFVQSICGSAR